MSNGLVLMDEHNLQGRLHIVVVTGPTAHFV